MSIPGLGQAVSVTALSVTSPESVPVIHEIQANSEWRFDIAVDQNIQVRILSGTAEIFGTEIALNHIYKFQGIKSSIFTWHGCRIEVKGECEEYTAEETPMIQYANTHFALEKLREKAEESSNDGPRVLVVGPSNAGKTSLVKILTAYALRMGRKPMVINTDSKEGLLSIPGTMTAVPFASILDVEQGWGSSSTSTTSPVPAKLPLCYYYGLESPEDNTKLYKPLLTRLALAATSRMTDDTDVNVSGMIIDTPGVISQGKGGYDLISHIVSEFSVNIILVLGSERLHSELHRRFSSLKTNTGESITLIKLDKSGGCVDRDEEYLRQSRECSIKEYFFGVPNSTLSPHTLQINFDEVFIYRIKEINSLSFMPGGEEIFDQELYEKIEPNLSMMNCILAVMYASGADSQETIRDASVMGFVYVSEVNQKKGKLKVLAPMNSKITERPLIWGSWPEPTVSIIS
ncbi:mRNA cleavage and polyadenylation factor clp1 [Erysiphe necator]|uniref:Polynucleotide 5'-hydroxyl-kinase GRC3 n=1 Tax=Uncinula necator TaxID=52586 RepID=A0A0B1P981_UNCNE|nr:mRNA cleavage and polyadenylation factor clp1 [Erysiphe necator]KHJ33526.1 putative pre-mrna cleavage complex ii protein clp1 [Erysiphe necator]